MFAGSNAGGEQSANILALFETAKLNGLEPERYLDTVLSKINDIFVWDCESFYHGILTFGRAAAFLPQKGEEMKKLGVATLLLVSIVVLNNPSDVLAEPLRPAVIHASPIIRVRGSEGHRIAYIDKSAWIGPMWLVDNAWDELVIGRHVTLTGNIVVPNTRKKPLIIRGRDRFSSRIVGTNTQEWQRTESDLARRHSAIFVDSSYPVTISTLTSLNPDKYHFVGYNHTILHVDHVDILDDRLAYTTDGVAGGRGTTIRDSYIGTYDDAIKVYAPDMVIENVTIVHNRNGAPLQFGWSNEEGSAKIRNLTVIAHEPEIYNQGIFGRAAQIGNTDPLVSSIEIEGLQIIVPPGMKSPPLFMWGTPDGQKVNNFTLRVNGLCTGHAPNFPDRASLVIVPRGSDDGVILKTPDCK